MLYDMAVHALQRNRPAWAYVTYEDEKYRQRKGAVQQLGQESVEARVRACSVREVDRPVQVLVSYAALNDGKEVNCDVHLV